MRDGVSKGLRRHIGVFGRRNVGKSSLVNALTGQAVSLVSAVPGTTTDPVEKPVELHPLGPVVFIDTAGLDDDGALGTLRVERTRRVIDRVDLALVVTAAGGFGPAEEQLLADLRTREIPTILVANQVDLQPAPAALRERAAVLGVPLAETSAVGGEGLPELLGHLTRLAPAIGLDEPLLGDLVRPGQVVVLVAPIDSAAPKGRLILPQVQAIRDALDADAITVVVKERGLAPALRALRADPALVVTDSQALRKVVADTPAAVPLTTFSILLARLKGDLETFVRGCLAIDQLRPGDRVLVAEACSHHPTGEDIGRVKIPRWLAAHRGFAVQCEVVAGRDFPDDLGAYRLVVHCGGCMLTRREVLGRLARCRAAGVPITNYGMTIAWSLGTFARALAPFPAALELWRGALAARPPAMEAAS